MTDVPAFSGILLVNKPAGLNAFAVVARLRRFTGVRRIGNVGTLDPFADGLLPVCIGRATRMVRFMDDYDKHYRLTVVFGRATDSQDATGRTIMSKTLGEAERIELRQSNFAVLRASVAALPGKQEQVPPMFSALKIDGKPLYAYARSGQTMPRKARPIVIHSAELIDVRLDDHRWSAVLEIRCSKGTYLRTIADDLGRRLGCGAYASALTRLASGPYRISQSVSLAEIEALWDGNPSQDAFRESLSKWPSFLGEASAVVDLPALDISAAEAGDLICGRALWCLERPPAGRIALFAGGRLVAVAVAREDEGRWRLLPERVLYDDADR